MLPLCCPLAQPHTQPLQPLVSSYALAPCPAAGRPGTGAAAHGRRVLLPITLDDMQLDWAEYTGAADLAPAAFGLLEPTGPRLGLDAIAAADVILAPALAIDRLGHRLGQGGGCYDRALPRASGEVIAVVADDELVESLPTEAHDLPVAAVVTPSAGLMRFPRG